MNPLIARSLFPIFRVGCRTIACNPFAAAVLVTFAAGVYLGHHLERSR